MKKLLLLVIVCGALLPANAQYIHTIKADSVLITNDSCTAELNLENSTKHIKGFLYNKGNGRTEFRKMEKLNDSTLVFGEDTFTIRGAGNSWYLTGNAGTDPAVNFLGTTDSQAVVIRTNNTERLRVTANGRVGINTSSPSQMLHVRNTESCCGGALFEANFEALSLRSNVPNGFPGMRVYNHNGNTYGAFSGRNSDKQVFIVADSGAIAFWTGAPTATRMIIETAGNVGILRKLRIHTMDSTTTIPNVLYQDPTTKEIRKGPALAYKKYVALLSQSGSDGPTATVLKNTLGGTIVWTRNVTGSYTGTLTGAFTQNKTWFSSDASDQGGNAVATRMIWNSANTVTLVVKDGTLANMDNWTNISIEIRVYQ